MRSTGIIRRIDDLGRVVIPREVRRSLHLAEGQPLEIYTDLKEGSVIFKRYDFLESSCEAIRSTMEFISNDEEIDNKVRRAVTDKLKEALAILKEKEEEQNHG